MEPIQSSDYPVFKWDEKIPAEIPPLVFKCLDWAKDFFCFIRMCTSFYKLGLKYKWDCYSNKMDEVAGDTPSELLKNLVVQKGQYRFVVALESKIPEALFVSCLYSYEGFLCQRNYEKALEENLAINPIDAGHALMVKIDLIQLRLHAFRSEFLDRCYDFSFGINCIEKDITEAEAATYEQKVLALFLRALHATYLPLWDCPVSTFNQAVEKLNQFQSEFPQCKQYVEGLVQWQCSIDSDEYNRTKETEEQLILLTQCPLLPREFRNKVLLYLVTRFGNDKPVEALCRQLDIVVQDPLSFPDDYKTAINLLTIYRKTAFS
jgi:hypothetical protein